MSYVWQKTSAPAVNYQSIACSLDGNVLVSGGGNAGFSGTNIYTSTNRGRTWTARTPVTTWSSFASSSTGQYLLACPGNAIGGNIYTSSDYGVTWTSRAFNSYWTSAASDYTGQYLVAYSATTTPGVYTSSNFGVNWTIQAGATFVPASIASNSTGQYLVAVSPTAVTGGIYTSFNYGVTWTRTFASVQNWTSVASSSSGRYLVACVLGGFVYTSNDYGTNWTTNGNSSTSQSWVSVASSADGSKLIISNDNSIVRTSIDYGVTWTTQTVANFGANGNHVASSSDGLNLAICQYGFGIYTTPEYLPCFKEGTKILTDQGYKAIEDLGKGDLVKTLKHGFLPVEILGKSQMVHNVSKERLKDQLYECTKENYSDVLEPLVITGCHSILVDWLTQEQGEKTMEDFGRIFMTDDKIRLMAFLDEKASVYEVPGTYTIYHLALENEDYYGNYGIYANGLLVESCSKRYLLEHSNMVPLF